MIVFETIHIYANNVHVASINMSHEDKVMQQ